MATALLDDVEFLARLEQLDPEPIAPTPASRAQSGLSILDDPAFLDQLEQVDLLPVVPTSSPGARATDSFLDDPAFLAALEKLDANLADEWNAWSLDSDDGAGARHVSCDPDEWETSPRRMPSVNPLSMPAYLALMLVGASGAALVFQDHVARIVAALSGY